MDNKKSRITHLPAIIFIIFVFGISIWFILAPKGEYSSSEKRYLQKFPEVSVKNIMEGTFSTEFETYFADHIPQRNFWVGLNSYYALVTGNNGAGGIYNAKDGYLINKPFSVENKIKKNTNAIIDFSKNCDMPVSVMLVPSTGYVLDDVLPAIHDDYMDDENFEEISSALSQDGIGFVDLRSAFKEEHKSGTQLYYKTDHHWTTSAAYVAYQQFCNANGIAAAAKESFDIEKYNDFYGTTYSSSGFWLNSPDQIEVWNNKKTAENVTVKITESSKTDNFDSMFFYDHLEEDDKYPVFLDGNHAITEIVNENADGGTILLVKDSFSHCFAPFLAENYSKVILVDLRYYKESVSVLAKTENAEQILVLYGLENFAVDTDIVWAK